MQRLWDETKLGLISYKRRIPILLLLWKICMHIVSLQPDACSTFCNCNKVRITCATTVGWNQNIPILILNLFLFLNRWDFKEYPVSNFAHGVLSGLSQEPLFVVEELNPALLQKVSKLKKALELRKQACEIAKYLTSCRIAKEVIKEEYYKECIIKVSFNSHSIRSADKQLT